MAGFRVTQKVEWEFLCKRWYLNAGDRVTLQMDTACNFLLVSDSNFAAYKAGRRFSYYGGFFDHSPAAIEVPSNGYWNVVIDLAGGSGSIRHTLDVIKRS